MKLRAKLDRKTPLPLTSRMASGESLHLSMPQFPHLLNGIGIVLISQACGGY